VGQVDDPQHAPRQRQAHGHQREQAAGERARDGDLEVEQLQVLKAKGSPSDRYARRRRRGGGAAACVRVRTTRWLSWTDRRSGAAARSSGQTITQSPSWICLMPWVVGQKLPSSGLNVRWPWNVVSAPFSSQVVADRLLVETACAGDAGGEDLPRRPAAGGLRLERRCTAGRPLRRALWNSSTISRTSPPIRSRIGSFGSNIETDRWPSPSSPSAQQRAGCGEQAEGIIGGR
jgi:hypothetical protein